MNQTKSLSLPQTLADLADRINIINNPLLKYKNMYALVLQEGQKMSGGKLPKNLKLGRQKQCFSNSFNNLSEDYFYCEGFVFVPEIRGLPIHHAWLLDKQTKKVCELTLRDDPEEIEYYGLKFDTNFLYDLIWARSQSSQASVISIFDGNYLDESNLYLDGFPMGALV